MSIQCCFKKITYSLWSSVHKVKNLYLEARCEWFNSFEAKQTQSYIVWIPYQPAKKIWDNISPYLMVNNNWQVEDKWYFCTHLSKKLHVISQTMNWLFINADKSDMLATTVWQMENKLFLSLCYSREVWHVFY